MWLFNEFQNRHSSQIYYFETTGGANNWITWEVPKAASLLYILAIGGGGGGGNGFLAASGNRGGGSGGGCANFCKLYVPTFLIPNTLYILPGVGGAGGSAGTASIVSVKPPPLPSTYSTSCLVYALGGGAGINGAATGQASAVSGAIPSTQSTDSKIGYLGIFASDGNGTSSAVGALAGSNSGGNVTAMAGTFLCGGSGGAGTATSSPQGGGSILRTANVLNCPQYQIQDQVLQEMVIKTYLMNYMG